MVNKHNLQGFSKFLGGLKPLKPSSSSASAVLYKIWIGVSLAIFQSKRVISLNIFLLEYWRNQFSTFGKFQIVEFTYSSNNNFSSNIPKKIGNCLMLGKLYLRQNKIGCFRLLKKLIWDGNFLSVQILFDQVWTFLPLLKISCVMWKKLAEKPTV